MRKFQRPEGSNGIPGVPARDLTEEEYAEHVKAGRIVEDEPTGALYEKEPEPRTTRRKEADE